MRQNGKPEYKVPSMEEIAAIDWNGYNVISTFSGCGGSSLGYKMAGFKVLWANEFIPIAAETYRLNHPGTIVDERDIRKIQPEDILEQIGMEAGQLDLMDGSPPCASFSTAGKREKKWGEVTKYSETTQRVDDLFWEYARLIEGVQPKVFIGENVSGLVKGKAKGYFKDILKRLIECGYNVKARLLDAQWLGVPQMRQRIIFCGVRNDLQLEPAYPKPLSYQYTVRDALPWIMSIGHSIGSKTKFVNMVEPETDISRFAIGREWDKLKPGEQSKKYFNLVKPSLDKPCPAVTQSAGTAWSPSAAAGVTHPTEKRKFSIAELKRICAFPDDFQLIGTYSQQWERLGRAVPPVMMYHIAKAVRDGVLDKCTN